MKIILPKTSIQVEPIEGPLFFLAGPIKGGGDWQRECVHEIRKHLEHFAAIIPCRYGPDHPLFAYKASGDDSLFERQLPWERVGLDLAATTGCVIFWLPRESQTAPRDDGNPYAMDTLGELGEWRGRMMHDRHLRVVVGAEASFPGLSQIERNFKYALGGNFSIRPTLTRTIQAAIARALT